MSASDILAVRDWVGSSPDDGTVQAVLDRFTEQAVDQAALSILKQRRADMVASPTAWATAGDYSESWTANLKALDDQIGQLQALVGEVVLPQVTTGQLHRTDITRFPRIGFR